jgi:NTE family protein
MLDHIEHDLEQVQLINEILADAVEAGGEGFSERFNRRSIQHGRPPRREIKTFVLHPSVDIGGMASQHLRSQRVRLGRILGRTALRMIDVGEGAEADLASYLLFDGDFARTLIDLGERDAAEHRDELAAFLLEEQ